jgi:putative methionine-R-sulfoxide reductase with GAF domain/anti-sigma regulatory factor (Ser/Thr protein kinase)
LPPGRYVFKVRASNDNKLWEEAVNTVTIDIAKPLWDQVWFKLLGILLVLGLIWYVINFYRKRQLEQREELETEVVINYFASRINSHQRTDDILWDVAKNCISKLNFEDCVIYLVDTERNVLVQKAAYGPKMERDFTIYKPIEIPVGKGIVGTVAQTGKAELIPNTELDERYIADDARRYSEVTVPLIIDDKVIGVIDSEHSKRNFFNQKHLNILSTVAVLCANQIQRAKSEEEKQQAKIEVLENRQKVTESRLQSLRLQMNPHFLFNALNSIQQMILANEEMVATRYLSRFSKLLRTILVHSDKESVTLKEELEILNLYVELESVRFRDSFQYSITCDEEIDKEEVKVPTLLVQPFVENAIWHGLMHKEGNRKLKIDFFEKNNCLRCVIEDNGIGREKSAQAKMNNGQRHVSKGIQVSLERLKNMENDNGQKGSLIIFDLKDDNGQPSGTRVEIDFPIQN